MNMESQIKDAEVKLAKVLQSFISHDKKNIVFLSYYSTYRSQYGHLVRKLSSLYNVIVVVSKLIGDEFEREAKECAKLLTFPYRIIDNGKTYYLNAEISGIDLILTADQVGYENGRIDREFLSKSAPRLYLPHRLTYECGTDCVYNNRASIDYINIPSKTALKSFERALKGTSIKMLKCGYPQLDNLIANYRYTPSNTLTYAPTLRYDTLQNTHTNALAGFDINCIEWLLAHTNYSINYRAHPINSQNNHPSYKLICARFRDNARVQFDTNQGYDYFNFSDFLITDWSSTSFLYSIATLRPSLYLMPYPIERESPQDVAYILPHARAKNMRELQNLIENLDFKKEAERFSAIREGVFNLGKSEEALIEEISRILKKKGAQDSAKKRDSKDSTRYDSARASKKRAK